MGGVRLALNPGQKGLCELVCLLVLLYVEKPRYTHYSREMVDYGVAAEFLGQTSLQPREFLKGAVVDQVVDVPFLRAALDNDMWLKTSRKHRFEGRAVKV